MRRAQLIGWIVVGGLVASAFTGAPGAPRRDSTLLAEDRRPVRLQGSLEIMYDARSAGCTTEPKTAQVESRVVDIRDVAGVIVASAVTGPRAVASSVALCGAETRFVAHLPRRQSYTFNVRELPGSAEPVSFEHLKASGFECPLRISVGIDLTHFYDLSCTPPRFVLRPGIDDSDPYW